MSSYTTLLSLSKTDVRSPLPKPDLLSALSSAPFIHVPGTFNTRDLGLLPTPSGVPCPLRPGFVYRTGSINGLTDDGKAILRDKLGVKKIFDLRSIREHATAPDPEWEGVEVVRAPSQEGDATVEIGEFVEGDGERGYVKMYLEVLELYVEGFRALLGFVRDGGGEGVLVHCNAGRDRTGVAAGLLLTLAGADAETVALDWMLSRIGTEPAREQLLAFAMKGAGVESVDAPGFYNVCSLKLACWEAFVRAVGEEYGGFEGYVMGRLGFSGEDLEVIKRNLRAE